MTSADRLAEIQARVEKTTPGVWKIWGMQVMADQKGTSNVDDAVLVAQTYFSDESGKPRTFDAQFIAQAHQDVPALVAALTLVLNRHSEHPSAPGLCIWCEQPYPCSERRDVEYALRGDDQ